jgi:Retroviral aspartyl protease
LDNATPILPVSPSTEKETAFKNYVMTAQSDKFPMIPVELKTVDTQARITIDALLDSGATQCYIDQEFVKKNNLNTRSLLSPIPVFNVDSTKNEKGEIKDVIDFILHVQDHTKRVTFNVIGLGKINAILGETWLKTHNPAINWNTGELQFNRCPRRCGMRIRTERKERRKVQ